MTKKLKIIGPYTPEHPGPFCTRDGREIELKFRDGRGSTPIAGYVGKNRHIVLWDQGGYVNGTVADPHDLMNAEEVPVAREFWVNEYTGGTSGKLHLTEASAKYWSLDSSFIRTIHVREVLPGDGE